MNTVIYSGYSDNNKELAMLTLPNKQQYAGRHGYEVVLDKIEWEAFKLEGLRRIRKLLDTADYVLAVGSDVLFMNHRMTIESMATDDRAVLSKETISHWPINNDVMLWQNNDKCRKLLDRLIADAPIWLQCTWLWQAYLWDLIQTEPEIAACVRIAEPREVQSVHQQGAGKWQLGDRIIHLLDYGEKGKIKMAELYLPLAGEPTFKTFCDSGQQTYRFVRNSFRSEEANLGPEGKPLWLRFHDKVEALEIAELMEQEDDLKRAA